MDRILRTIFCVFMFAVFSVCFAADLHIKVTGCATMARVEILETGESGNVDSLGRVAFQNLSPEDYTLCVIQKDRKEICKEVSISENDTLVEAVINIIGSDGPVGLTDTTAVLEDSLKNDMGKSEISGKKTDNADSTGYLLEKVTVKSKGMEKRILGKQTITREAIKRLPGLAEPDVMRAIQLLPGVVASSDFSNKLYVRGGAADQNLVLLDNAVVYSPSHFFGLFSTFAVDAIKELQFYKGGFPAKYGNRLSSVVDVRQRNAKQGWIHGYTGISLLSAKAGLEGNFPRGGWIINGRRMYMDKVTDKLNKWGLMSFSFPYYFYDGQAKINYSPLENLHLSYSFYKGNDFLDFMDVIHTDWGNEVHAINYAVEITDKVKYKGTISYSNFKQTFEVAAMLKMFNNISDTTIKQEIVSKISDRQTLTIGGEANRYGVDFSQLLTFDDNLEFADYSFAHLYSGFADYSWDISRKLNMAAGLRGTYYQPTKFYGAEPRLSLTYKYSSETKWMMHIGTYYQFLTSILFGDPDRMGNPIMSLLQEMRNEYWYSLQGNMPATKSKLASLGVNINKMKDYSLTYETYLKTFDNLPVFTSTPPMDISVAEQQNYPMWKMFDTQKGYSFGHEVLIKKEKGFINGYLSCALGFSVLNKDSAYWANWDKRFSTDLVMNFDWYKKSEKKPDLKIMSNFVNILGSGFPYSRIIGMEGSRLFGNTDDNFAYIYGSKNMDRYPVYWRVDVTPIRMEYSGKHYKWALYYQIINLFDNKNVFIYYYDVNIGIPEKKEITMLPRIPVFVGFELTF